MSLNDADLIARVLASRDEHAFAELVRRYQSPIRAFLVRMTRGDAHGADDLAQETFLKAWRKLHTFCGSARFSTWLFGIALNEFRAAARRRKEPLAADMKEMTRQEEEPAASGDAPMRMDLNEALKLLNTQERAAILLCCQNGLSHDEAAGVLGCPLGTVKTNILRGKEKLRQQLSVYHEAHETV